MSGRLSDADLSTIKESYDPEQSSLSQFGCNSVTTIAVVREPTQQIENVCDEWYPELGVPHDVLSDYWSLRSAYNSNQYVSSDSAANRAYHEADVSDRYKSYIRNSDAAQERLDEIVMRLNNGEDITLVCFEDSGKKCHRHIIVQMLESRQKLTQQTRLAD